MKHTILAICFSVACMTVNAQFYFRAGVGYALPAAGQTLNGEALAYNGSSKTSTAYDLKSASFSAGASGTLGLGYMINRNVGMQLDLNIGTANKQYAYELDSVTVSSVLSNVIIKTQAIHPVMLLPSLVLQTGGSKTNIYCRMGLALPLRTTVQQNRIFTNLPGTGAQQVENEQWKFTSNFSLGYSAAAGVSWKLSDKMDFWAELSILSLSVYLKEEYFDAVTVNGQSYNLSQYNINRSLYYSKSGNTDSVHFATYSQPFSNVGLNVGVRLRFTDNRQKSAMKRENSFD